jgi:hypothetical protein
MSKSQRLESATRSEPFNEPALAGGILVAPGVSPGKRPHKKPESPEGATEISAALFQGSRLLGEWFPGLTPGAKSLRHLRWLIDRFSPNDSNGSWNLISLQLNLRVPDPISQLPSADAES